MTNLIRKKIITRLGDANPVEHGGGIVAQITDKSHAPPDIRMQLEYTHGIDYEDLFDDNKKKVLKVFVIEIPKDLEIPSWLSEEDLNGVNSFCGRDFDIKKESEKTNTNTKDLFEKTEMLQQQHLTIQSWKLLYDMYGIIDYHEWGQIFWDLANYFGTSNFDDSPWKFTPSELNLRWGLYRRKK